MARIELNEQNLDDVVGGAFSWSVSNGGMTKCRVSEKGVVLGNFNCTDGAKSRFNALKLEHKLDNWTCSQYLDVLIAEGYFTRNE